MIPTIMAAIGGLMLGAALYEMWRRPKRDKSGRFARKR
jgi:hypothetical protein